MPSIAAAEAQLRADNRPVLFLDTCVIVDIIRATLRCMGTHFVPSAVDSHGLLKSVSPGCALVIASMVEKRGHVLNICTTLFSSCVPVFPPNSP